MSPLSSPAQTLSEKAGAGSGFSVSRLMLTDFRSYRSLSLAVGDDPVILTGANGAGKTNILEAISLLAPGRGLRRVGLPEFCADDGAGGFAVAADIDGPAGSHKLGTGRDAAAASGDRRRIRVDGEDSGSAAAFAPLLRMIWLTPSMDRLFVEAPAGRRRFLDRLVMAFDPAHGGRVSAYEKVMRDRSRLLKTALDQGGKLDESWVQALETQMAEHGVSVAAARLAMASRLTHALQDQKDWPAASITVDGVYENLLGEGLAAVDVEDRMIADLAARRSEDMRAGRALAGPHLTDLQVTYLPKNAPAARCSTGEQKALLIALLLAEARLVRDEAGGAPLMLLDEVAAHLDDDRRARLFDALTHLGVQAWMTGTDKDLFTDFKASSARFHLEGGKLAPYG